MSTQQGQLSYQQGGMVNSFQVLLMNLDSGTPEEMLNKLADII